MLCRIIHNMPHEYDWTPTAIRSLRKALGYSQETLAAILKTERSLISRWENGITKPRAKNQAKLSELLERIPLYKRPVVAYDSASVTQLTEKTRPKTHLILCEESPTYRALALAEGAFVPPHLLT